MAIKLSATTVQATGTKVKEERTLMHLIRNQMPKAFFVINIRILSLFLLMNQFFKFA